MLLHKINVYFEQKTVIFTLYYIYMEYIAAYIYAKKSRKYFFLDFFVIFLKILIMLQKSHLNYLTQHLELMVFFQELILGEIHL